MFEPIYIFTQMELSVESLCKSFLKKTPKFEKKRKKKAEQLSIQMYIIILRLHTRQIMHPRTKNLAICIGLHMRAHAKVNKETSSAEQGTCKHSQKFWHRDWEF